MEIIRRDTDYAIRALLHLALSGKGAMSCSALAKAAGIPRSFAYKILKRMADANIVASRNGRTGGFRLKKNPKRIFLRAVVEAVQGQVAVSKCVLDLRACPRRESCPLTARWSKLEHSILDFLDRTTLNDLLVATVSENTRSRRR